MKKLSLFFAFLAIAVLALALSLIHIFVMGILGAYTYKRLRKTIPDVL